MSSIDIRKCHPDAKLPTYESEGAACFDFYTITEGSPVPVLICRTGIAVAVPEGHVMLLFSRSGHGFKHNTRLANCVGVIDSDYRGEIVIKLTHDGDYRLNPYYVTKSERVAQGMVVPVARVVWNEVAELPPTARGEGGFGSTGK